MMGATHGDKGNFLAGVFERLDVLAEEYGSDSDQDNGQDEQDDNVFANDEPKSARLTPS